MNPFTKTTMQLILTLVAILPGLGTRVSAQNSNCAPNLCYNRYGQWGTGDAYCGISCVAGPCYAFQGGNTGPRVADIVTDSFFNGIAYRTGSNCPGRVFYTRSAFLQAARSYPTFGNEGSAADSRREVAAFFAHVTLATRNLCYIEELNGASRVYCDANNRQYPCVSGQRYYGRGPLQLSWNYNYGAAGQSIGFDGLNHPDIVATDPVISFKTALWFWMRCCHGAITSGRGFGATIRSINGPFECDGENPRAVTARVIYYIHYSIRLRVDPGVYLRC